MLNVFGCGECVSNLIELGVCAGYACFVRYSFALVGCRPDRDGRVPCHGGDARGAPIMENILNCHLLVGSVFGGKGLARITYTRQWSGNAGGVMRMMIEVLHTVH